jgi:hypothetical protein
MVRNDEGMERFRRDAEPLYLAAGPDSPYPYHSQCAPNNDCNDAKNQIHLQPPFGKGLWSLD